MRRVLQRAVWNRHCSPAVLSMSSLRCAEMVRWNSATMPRGRISNPFNNLDRVKHWHMILMCICCAFAGIAVGQLIDVDEDRLRKLVLAPFEREEIEKEFFKIFELNPQLAATFLRLAFADLARRCESTGRLKPGSGGTISLCLSEAGLGEARRMIDTLHVQFPTAGKMDLAALGAIAAVRFLKGPADKIEFMWGRGDTGTMLQKKSLVDSLTEPTVDGASIHGRFLSGGNSSNVVYTQLHAMIPTLNFEEAVALMAAHCVGEFHPKVSGIDGTEYNRLSRHKYFLGCHYYQLMIDHAKVVTPAVLPPVKESSFIQEVSSSRGSPLPKAPPMMEAVAEMKHPVTGQPMQRKALVTVDEVNSITKDGEGSEIATMFAMDQGMWRQHFASGMTKLLNAHCTTLKAYHSANSVKRDKDERAKVAANVSRDYRPASGFGSNTDKRQ